MLISRWFRRSVLLSLAGLLAAQMSAHAQSIPSSYRFIDQSQGAGLFAGYISTTKGTVGLGPKAGPTAGARYSIRVSGPFTLELDGSYFTSKRPVLDTTLVDSARVVVGEADFSLLMGNVGLRFNLTGPRTWHGIQPFALFGGGMAADLSGTSADDEKVTAEARFDFGTSFAGQLGGGIEWFPSDQLTFRVDARNVLWKIKAPLALVSDSFGGALPASEWAQNGWFTVGLTLRF
jgi:hypothetical protein